MEIENQVVGGGGDSGGNNQAGTVSQALERLRDILAYHRFSFASETDLQFGVQMVFLKRQITFSREFKLSHRDRPDFFLPVPGLAIEIKVDGSTSSVIRQLHRYAEHEAVKGIFLLTSRMRHQVPETLNDKPVMAVTILGI